MKHYLLLSLSFCLFCTHLYGKNFSADESPRDSIMELFLFQKNRSTTSLLMPKNYKKTEANINYFYSNGDYFSPLDLGNKKGLDVKIQSILTLKSWNLYGKVNYTNFYASKSYSALMYPVSYLENPLFIFQNHSSNWNIQDYKFEVLGNRYLDREMKWNIGFNAVYDGVLTFKRTDVRNEQTRLNIVLTSGIGYQLNDRWKIALDLGMKLSKTIPQLSIIYNHPSNDVHYNNYVNLGMGSMLLSSGTKYKIKDVVPKMVINITHDNSYKQERFASSILYNLENWQNINLRSSKIDNKVHSFKSFKIQTLYEVLWRNKTNRTILGGYFSYQDGNTYYRPQFNGRFIRTSTLDNLNLQLLYRKEKYSSFIKGYRSSLNISYNKLHDNNFGILYKLIRIQPSVRTTFLLLQNRHKHNFEISSGIQLCIVKDLTEYQYRKSLHDNLLGEQFREYLRTNHLNADLKLSYLVNHSICIYSILNYKQPFSKNYVSDGQNDSYMIRAGLKINY